MSYDNKEKRVFSCDTKEENMDSCTRFSISVGFFFTYEVISLIK